MKKKPASMRVKKEVEQNTENTCGDCALPEWNDENRNYKGETFLGYCEFGRNGFCRSRNKGVTFKDKEACEHFRKGGAE